MKQCPYNPAVRYIGAVVLLALLLGLVYNLTLSPEKRVAFSPKDPQPVAEQPAAVEPASEHPAEVELVPEQSTADQPVAEQENSEGAK